MDQGVDCPQLGCPSSLWSTSCHSHEGHKKPPPPHRWVGSYRGTEQGASANFPCGTLGRLYLTQGLRSPPLTPHEDRRLILPWGSLAATTASPGTPSLRPSAWALVLRAPSAPAQEPCTLGAGSGRPCGRHTLDVAAPFSPHCFQVSICPHLRKSSVSKTQGCSCVSWGASSLVAFLPLVWASPSSSWSPEPPASLSLLPAFLRYRLRGSPSPILEGSPRGCFCSCAPGLTGKRQK